MTQVSGDVARSLEALPEVMRLVEKFFNTAAADPAVRYPVELALEEIFTNVVRHNSRGSGAIRIDLGIICRELVITVTDFDAPRFDPVADGPVPDVTAPLTERLPGGLGLHLVKKMMDRIEYSHTNRKGTITLHKRMN